MTPFPTFENHLFISYGQIDNARFAGVEKGWVDHLHERLEICLAQELGKPPKIWRDPQLSGNRVFHETIVIELSKSAILLSVMSPRYLQSSSCRQELDDFVRLAAENGGVTLDDKHRVFKVVKTYVPFEEHPSELRDLLGYEFYQRDQASGRVREFDHEISSRGDKDPRYWDKFKDLVWDIKELVLQIEGSQPGHTPPPGSGTTIYLAETSFDLSEERDKVKRELQQYGHLVLPDKALPLRALPLQEAVRDYLKRSQLSVHLIGKEYGIIPEMESERSIVRLQQELAIERGDNAEFSRLIWMPPGLQPKDTRQQRFVVDLQNSFSSHNGSELLQVKLEDLKTIIQAKLAEKRKTPPPTGQNQGPTRVYLICDQQDVDAAEPLQNYLLEQKYETTLPLLEGSQAEVFEDHKENLLICDALLIFQDRASEGWLRMKLRELLKLPGYGRTKPLLGKAIYVGGPESPSKKRFKILDPLVIKNHDEFDPTSLEPFMALIKGAKGGAL